MEIHNTLEQRGSRYGSFEGHAEIVQSLKLIMHNTPNWNGLSVDKKEALDMIMHKIGRILNGDPEYQDSWHDIGGYAKLIERNLVDEE